MSLSMVSLPTVECVPEKTFRILQIEDNPAYARLVELMLEKTQRYQCHLVHVRSLDDAVDRLQEQAFDVVLLDLSLPDSEGLVTLERTYNAAPELPIILLTASKDDDVSLQAVQFGAQDYLVKGEFNAELLIRVISYAIDRKQAELDLMHMAQYDALTGLANRHLFMDRLEQALIRSKRSKTALALLYLDLDHFKSINDTLGHDFGDLLLHSVAQRLQSCVREQDTVARLGGDEFTVILEQVGDQHTAWNIGNKIIQSIAEAFFLHGHEIFTTASIGVALFNGDEDISAKSIIKQADTAMYYTKEQGKDGMLLFTADMDEQTKSRLSVEQELRHALSRKQFELVYQPQIDLHSGCLLGAEALLRWRHPEFGDMPVQEFIPLLESTGLIVSVGEWALKTACQQWQEWTDAGFLPLESTVSVNFSARQFWQKNLYQTVTRILAETGLSPAQLDLELTESLLLKHNDENIQALEALRRMGVSLTIDDFGTGFSSLTYLKYFPINRLKVDRSFVKDILQSQDDMAIATAIINLASDLNLQVIAEGVDSKAKVDLLQSRGCTLFQGYYFSEPLSVEHFSTTFNDRVLSARL